MSVLDFMKRLGADVGIGNQPQQAPQGRSVLPVHNSPIALSNNPQATAGVNAVQPVRGGWEGMLQNAPVQVGVPQYSITDLVNAYNQNQANNQDLSNVSKNIPQGQPGGMPAYHNLSAQQHAAAPWAGGFGSLPGTGIAKNAWHALFGG